MMETLTALLQRAQSGDAEAYSTLVARFQDMAYGYAYTILNDFDLAQDAAQEAFIEAYRCLPTLEQPLAFPAWFKRIVFKHCDRLTRRRKLTTASLENIEETASALPSPVEIAEQKEFNQFVQNAIQDLSFPQREVTTLFYIDGYSYQEIADFLELPARTVKSRLYSSRQRLKERMLDMVHEELKANALPEQFTHQTVEQAVARAQEFNQEQKYDQAEKLLRKALALSPGHPEALKALNRALMKGQVYGQGRWELLPELAAQGRMILQTSNDEETHRQIVHTLLAVPVMPEAISFLEQWITDKGANLERLGMLAWAKGCVAEYGAAEILWQKLKSLSKTASPEEVLKYLPFAAYTLVDCYAEAGELARAQRVALSAWEFCRDLGPLPTGNDLGGDPGWLMIFKAAHLDFKETARCLLKRYTHLTDPSSQAACLSIRSWVDDPLQVSKEWLTWVAQRAASGEWLMIEEKRFSILRGLRARGDWQAANQLAQQIWEFLGEISVPEAVQAREPWDWERFNIFGAIVEQDWQAAEELTRRELAERGKQEAGWAIILAAARGTPTPPELVQAVAEGGIASVDGYGLFGWYLVAREAAASGDEDKAFEALRRSLSYWSNTPYWITNFFEKDTRWGSLSQHPEFKQAFEQRRQRIGPIYGLLHYFPAW